MVRLILTLTKYLWDDHKEHAHAVRSQEDSLAYYLSMSKGGYLASLGKTVALLSDLSSLRFCGFTTEWSLLRGTVTDPLEAKLQYEDGLAHDAFTLVLNLL
eukprot:2778823-Lingulodinium_polyedra.AAC.1